MIFDQERFSAMIKARRGTRSLREIIREVDGTSVATLSRVERGTMPDLYTFITLCIWLHVEPSAFFIRDQPAQPLDTLEQVEILLRTDGRFPDEFVTAVIHLCRVVAREEERPEA